MAGIASTAISEQSAPNGARALREQRSAMPPLATAKPKVVSMRSAECGPVDASAEANLPANQINHIRPQAAPAPTSEATSDIRDAPAKAAAGDEDKQRQDTARWARAREKDAARARKAAVKRDAADAVIAKVEELCLEADRAEPDVAVEADRLCAESFKEMDAAKVWSNDGVTALAALFKQWVQVRPLPFCPVPDVTSLCRISPRYVTHNDAESTMIFTQVAYAVVEPGVSTSYELLVNRGRSAGDHKQAPC